MPDRVNVNANGTTTTKELADTAGRMADVEPLCVGDGPCYLDGYLATKAARLEWKEIEASIAHASAKGEAIPERNAFLDCIPDGTQVGDPFRPTTLHDVWTSLPILRAQSPSGRLRFFKRLPHVLPRDRLDTMAGHAIVTEQLATQDVRLRFESSLVTERTLTNLHVGDPPDDANSVEVRVEVASHPPVIVRRPSNETLDAFLQRCAAPEEVEVRSNRPVLGVQSVRTARFAQLRGISLEVTATKRPTTINLEPQTTLIEETIGTDRRKAQHTTDANDRRGKALNETERRQIMHMLDLAEHNRQVALENGTQVPPDKKLSYRKIAELTGKHHNTIAKLMKQRTTQECRREKDERTGMMRTLDAPVAGRQGGFRWCRLNDEQKQLCTRIAIENPKLTTTQIRTRIQEAHPELTTLSDSTVWRVLHDSNLQFLRAKMKDPKAEGTTAHKEELAAFLQEQQKGDKGQLGALNLFFMDETLVSLNETMTRSWGTTTKPGVIKHAKGKTQTIGLHAGLGLVSKSFTRDEWGTRKREWRFDGARMDKYAPRGNHMVLRSGQWDLSPEAPRFMLFWMLRPPGRKEDSLPRFIGKDDILDSKFTLFLPSFRKSTPSSPDEQLKEEDLDPLESGASGAADRLVPKVHVWEKLCGKAGAVKAVAFRGDTYVFDDARECTLVENGAFNLKCVRQFCNHPFDDYTNVEFMAKLLWLNNVEWRQVDDDGEIISLSSVNVKPHKVWCTLERMKEYMRALQALVAHTVVEEHNGPDDVEDLKTMLSPLEDVPIPRAYHGKLARQKIGGVIESKRGDRSNFLRYLVKHNEYMLQSFPKAEVHDNLVEVWDSAADHGAVDITKQDKSFMHDWVQRHLQIRGCVFLPARQPDFNPTELLFSFVKGVVKRRFPSHTGEVTVDQMIRLIDEAFQEVTEEMIKGWLRYGCYRIPNDPKSAIVERNDRCGYTHIPTIDIWEELITDWERRNFAIDPAIRADFVANDFTKEVDAKFKKARTAFGARFRKIYDIFGQTKRPIQTVEIGPPYAKLVVEFGKSVDKLDTDIPLSSPILIVYQASQDGTLRYENNY